MTETSAREALLSLAAELDRLAHWPYSVAEHDMGLARAARLARERAASPREAPNGPGGVSPDTGRLPVGLRAAAEAIDAEMGTPAQHDPWSLARAALLAAEPFIRTAERERIEQRLWREVKRLEGVELSAAAAVLQSIAEALEVQP